MDQKTPFGVKHSRDAEQPKTFYVDGCKVTVHYSQEENPEAVRGIREILLSGAKCKKC